MTVKGVSLQLITEAKNRFDQKLEITLKPKRYGDNWTNEVLEESVTGALDIIENNIEDTLTGISSSLMGVQTFDCEEFTDMGQVTFEIGLSSLQKTVRTKTGISYQALSLMSPYVRLELVNKLVTDFMGNVMEELK